MLPPAGCHVGKQVLTVARRDGDVTGPADIVRYMNETETIMERH
jgi:hypothetical protein